MKPGKRPAFLLSSRPADFVRKPPSARLMSQFEFRLPDPLRKFGSEFSMTGELKRSGPKSINNLTWF